MQTARHTFFSRFRDFDHYGEKPRFTVGGKSAYKTVFGSVLTLITLFALVAYGSKKLGDQKLVVGYNRSVYTWLEILSELGGLYCALSFLCTSLISSLAYCHGSGVHYFIATTLFRRNPDKTSSSQEELNTEKDQIRTAVSNINSRVPYAYRFWNFLCPSKKESRMFRKGKRHIGKELDITNFLTMQKSMRVVIKTLFSELERNLIRNNQLFVLNSSSSSSACESDTEVQLEQHGRKIV